MLDWTNENQTAAQVIYNWRKEDKNGELTEPCTLDAIIYDEIEDGAELDNDAIFDALATENKRLERTAQLVGRSLNRTSSTLKIVENGIHVSKPMRKNGVTNIAIIYELTDGQTVSVLFHNPDTTPNKLKPNDMMIAWRWLLNRKDITIVVAKEKGRDLPIQQIANRVMALADKNTARFAKANAKKAEETQLIKALEEENAKLEERLEHLNKLAKEKENSVNPENIEEKQEDAETLLNDAPIELTGKEFGYSENMSIDELREKAIQHLETTMRNDWVDVPALKQVEETTKVQLRKRGFNHIKEHSPSPEKLLILSKIKQLLSTSKYLYSANNVKTSKKPRVEKYHYLSKQFKFKGELFTCVIVIEKYQDGMLHYDILMDKYAQLHLNKAKEKMTDNVSQERSLGDYQPSNQPESSGVFDNTAIFDEAQEKYVLNLFIFDENGNEIKDEEENSEDEHNSGSLKEDNEIDIENLDKDLSAYQQNGEPVFEAAKAYYRDKLQGKMVTAVNGFKVHLLGSTWREMKKGMNKDEMKSLLIPFVPEILAKGKYDGQKELYKQPTNKRYIRFHSFSKEGLNIAEKIVQARVMVGELESGEYEFSAYSLHHNNGATMDKTIPTEIVQENARVSVGIVPAPEDAWVKTIQFDDDKVNHFVLDSIADGKDGWNIEIISINGIPFDENGNEIKDEEDEDNSGSLNDEITQLITSANENTYQYLDYLDVSEQEVEDAKQHGLDIAGYKHVIDTNAVNHIKKQHGNEKTERERGQIAITDEDFKNLFDVISTPNKRIYGGKTSAGLDTIVYVKRLPDNSTVVVEEVRSGREKLAVKTMWKHTATTDTNSIIKNIEYSQSNVQNDSGRAVENLTQNSEEGNAHFIAVFNDFIDYVKNEDNTEYGEERARRIENVFSDHKQELGELLNRQIFYTKYFITEEFSKKFTPQKTFDFIDKLNNEFSKQEKFISWGIGNYCRYKSEHKRTKIEQPEFNVGYEEELSYLMNTAEERRTKADEERLVKIRQEKEERERHFQEEKERKKREQYEKEKHWRNPMNDFLATLPKMKAVKAKGALTKNVEYFLPEEMGGYFEGVKAEFLIRSLNNGGWFMRNAKRRERIKNSWGEYEYGDFREVNNASELVYKETGQHLNMTMTDKAFFEFLENNYQKDKE